VIKINASSDLDHLQKVVARWLKVANMRSKSPISEDCGRMRALVTVWNNG
jgi:hypothetical protein